MGFFAKLKLFFVLMLVLFFIGKMHLHLGEGSGLPAILFTVIVLFVVLRSFIKAAKQEARKLGARQKVTLWDQLDQVRKAAQEKNVTREVRYEVSKRAVPKRGSHVSREVQSQRPDALFSGTRSAASGKTNPKRKKPQADPFFKK